MTHAPRPQLGPYPRPPRVTRWKQPAASECHDWLKACVKRMALYGHQRALADELSIEQTRNFAENLDLLVKQCETILGKSPSHKTARELIIRIIAYWEAVDRDEWP